MTKDFSELFSHSLAVREPWHIADYGFHVDERAVHVHVKAEEGAQHACPLCGAPCERHDLEENERKWRHGDVAYYPCYVHCRRPRVHCPEHGVRTVRVPWAREKSRFTALFEAHTSLLLSGMPAL